ncbi:hypothetical protein G6W47_02490 [Streptomyces sp. CAI-21]|uniref:hypothetical protein n=1 Tax=Streptomyces TaxID=1883 RepID=UPI000524EC69|nr:MULTISPECIES: hypothetical protein [Streptomyces]MBO1284399.1 hypothetical protein [Streptomyces sampsonii]NUW05798.1 hypothetical protein [Streptomyces sp. CAI-21]NVI32080.1 hypothetical protein [Streptomyces sp. CAI-17]MCX5456872.1 hypothetical protein [Streptomyces sp. FT1]WAC97654.1 hypothetical protein OSU72_16530 [Streptomyces sp. NA13]
MRTQTVSNRAVIALLGCALLGAGLWLLTAQRVVAERLPAEWRGAAPEGFLPDRQVLQAWRTSGWWTPVVVAVGTAATLGCLWWLLGRFPRCRRPHPTVPLSVPHVRLDLTALEDAVCRDARRVEGVVRVRCRVLVRRGGARVHLRMWIRPGAAPNGVLERLPVLVGDAEQALRPRRVVTRVRISTRGRSVARLR